MLLYVVVVNETDADEYNDDPLLTEGLKENQSKKVFNYYTLKRII